MIGAPGHFGLVRRVLRRLRDALAAWRLVKTPPSPTPARRAARAVLPLLSAGALLAGCAAGTAATVEPTSGGPASSASAVPSESAPADSPTPTASPTPTLTRPASTPSASASATPSPTPTRTGPDTRQQVQVITTYSGWQQSNGTIVVGAYVANLVENGGQCTVTVDGPAGAHFTSSRNAVADAKTTACGQLAVAVQTSGTWKASVQYSSATSRGTSSVVEVVVP